MTEERRYVVLDKHVGETPLSCTEAWRKRHPEYLGVPLAYAGRLDPMASGKLLVLIGDECKVQESYHNLDKEYRVEVLFGVTSDSGDVLGLITEVRKRVIDEEELASLLPTLVGSISLPYPVFSARTVQGIPLHTWAVTGRLGEITVPTKTSTIYSLALENISDISRTELVESALAKIALLPTVTDPRKALGNDFRRPEVIRSWETLRETGLPTDRFSVATITCIASSGTYMRSLAEEIAKRLGSGGLALSIHRETIGHYDKAAKTWRQSYT